MLWGKKLICRNSSHFPSARITFTAFGVIWIPAPTSPKAGARSNRWDSIPNLPRVAASANPPIPPPIMPTRNFLLMPHLPSREEGKEQNSTQVPCSQMNYFHIVFCAATIRRTPPYCKYHWRVSRLGYPGCVFFSRFEGGAHHGRSALDRK